MLRNRWKKRPFLRSGGKRPGDGSLIVKTVGAR